jgi:hypothetical protein
MRLKDAAAIARLQSDPALANAADARQSLLFLTRMLYFAAKPAQQPR